MNIKLLLAACFLSVAGGSFAQVLSHEEAIQIALAHNYDIQLAQKQVETAENNASINNSGYLPTVTASGNGSLSFNGGSNQTVQGDFDFDPAQAINYSASLGLNYTIFNGMGRHYSYKQLQEAHNLTELQAKQIVENTVIQLSQLYYQVASLEINSRISEDNITISRQRLERAQSDYEYGQGTRLAILNAQVDLSNDSISLMNLNQQLQNARRNLNLVLGRDIKTSFTVDTNVSLSANLNLEELTAKALERNVQIEQTSSQLLANEFAFQASRAGWFPTLSANASYNYSGSDNPNGAFLIGNSSYGPTAGLSLSWNVFDGGRTKTQAENARIAIETGKIQQQQAQQSVMTSVANAYDLYTNQLFVLEARETGLLSAQRNFERSQEMFRQAQITSIEFRQAQLNLQNAQSTLNQARFDAKNAELSLLQLAGSLLPEGF